MAGREGLRSYKLFYFFLNLGLATHVYMNLYFKELGLNGTQIGMLRAVGPLVMLASQPVWGLVADLTGKHRRILGLLLIGASATFSLVLTAREFLALLIIMLVYSVFFGSITMMTDSITLSRVGGNQQAFSRIRLWWALGAVFGTLPLGYLLERAPLASIFPLYALCMMVGFALTHTFQEPEARVGGGTVGGPGGGRTGGSQMENRAGRRGGSVWGGQEGLRGVAVLVGSRPFARFLLGVLLLQAAYFGGDNFYPLYVAESGGSNTVLAVSYTIGGISEILGYRWLSRWDSAFRNRRLLILSALLFALRWLICLLSPGLPGLVASQLLQGVTFTLFYVASATYVRATVGDRFCTTAQSVLWAVGFAIAPALGNWGGGVIADLFGLRAIYYFAFFAALGAGVSFSGVRYRIKGAF
ncbi:MAG: MFS transporter [Syntrophothermus sp.]